MNKTIQCTYCKNNNQMTPSCEFFNVQGTIAHGCGVCKAYAAGEKSYEAYEKTN